MLPIIVEAAGNFCRHQIRLPYEFSAKKPEGRTLFAFIDFDTQRGERYRAFIGCNLTLIQTITEVFLGEEQSSDQTLIDMLLETTNMIVGSAKVLATDVYETNMHIKTPFLLEKAFEVSSPEELQTITIGTGELHIAIERLDA